MQFFPHALVGASLVLIFACARNNHALQPLTDAITARERADAPADLKTAVRSYVGYLDSLRMANSREARSEIRKYDGLTLTTMILGSAATVIALLSTDDETKATWSGITGAASALGVGVISQYRHQEDAAAYRVCSIKLEAILIGFEFPATWPAFDSTRTVHRDELVASQCVAPLDF
jgi:hypothetical protein